MSSASDFYLQRGYKYHPVDWAVEREFNEVTFQGPLVPLLENKFFVGSAEQGFIKDYQELESGCYYFAISPCVRIGDFNRSSFHQPYFLKLELFYKGKNKEDNEIALKKIMDDAFAFFSQFKTPTTLKKEDGSFDLEINQIEVGSYGIRDSAPYFFVYGTGVAEPRLSQALGEKND